MFSTILATAEMESLIEPPTPPGQPRCLFDDSMSLSAGSSPLDSSHCTERPVEDGVPIAPGLPSSEKQPQWIAFPFRTHFSTINQGSACSKLDLTTWDRVFHHLAKRHLVAKGPLRARTRKNHQPESTPERMLQLESVMAYLRETSSFSTAAEDEPLVWLMKNEILLERIYEQLLFTYFRLTVYVIACLWFYSVFPGRIRPPCTTMPWTIWPALIVLWGVCWMFYPSPGSAPGAGELETQSHLHQPQPEEFGGEFLFSASDEADLIFPFLEDSSFSDGWWAPHQLNTICDPLTMTMDHNTGAYPPDSARRFSPMTTVDPTRSPTNSLHLGSGSQLTLSPGVQQRPQSQGSEPVAVGITENIATTASGSKTTNRFQCPQCYKVLSRRDALERHQRSQHNRVEEHLCPHKPCKHSRKGFARPDGLRRHLKACKSRTRRAATVALEPMDSQPDSGLEMREDSQARNSGQGTCSTQGPNDASSQQSPTNSWEAELRKRYKEAKEVCVRKKREVEEAQQQFEEAQRVLASYETLIGNAEKERAA